MEAFRYSASICGVTLSRLLADNELVAGGAGMAAGGANGKGSNS